MIGSNLNALTAHTAWMGNNAHNIANVNTPEFGATATRIDAGPNAVAQPTASPTDLSRELPEQIVIEGGFAAQISAIRTQDEMLGTLLDTKG